MHVLLSSASRGGVTVDEWWPPSSSPRDDDDNRTTWYYYYYYRTSTHYCVVNDIRFSDVCATGRGNENNAKNYHGIEIEYYYYCIRFRDGSAKKSDGLRKNERKKVKTEIIRYTRRGTPQLLHLCVWYVVMPHCDITILV